MNTLTFEITPCPISNDHQARILIDGTDWLGQDSLGLDPPRLFAQPSLTEGGKTLVGRCDCGCEGCCDVHVDVLRQGQDVLWTNEQGLRLQFNLQEYASVIAAARNDFSWEDTNRTAERLVTEVFADVKLEGGYSFDWASARVHKGFITLSFSKSRTQKLLEFPWDGGASKDALDEAKRFYKQTFVK